MGERYLLIAGGAPHERVRLVPQIESRLGLHLTASTPSFHIWVHRAPTVDLQQRGCIIGAAFERHGPPKPIIALDENSIDTIAASRGRDLVQQYWGSYVAALETGADAILLRAPFGGLPCYFTSHGRFTAAASDVDLLVRSGLFTLQIDWDELGRELYLRNLPGSRTALHDLDELLPGSALILDRGARRVEQYWSPWDHIASKPHPRNSFNIEQARRVIHNAIVAGTSGHDQILATVSGGLDSSVVAATLASQRKAMTCLTLATDDPSGDERVFARVLCDHLYVPLIEGGFDLDAVDVDRSVAAHLPRPCGALHEQAFRAAVQELAGAIGATAYVSGNGGDNVFYNSASARPIADRWLVQGPSRGMLRTMRDVCAVTGAGAGDALRQTFKQIRMRRTDYRWPQVPLFVAPDFIQAQQDKLPDHPWLSAPAGALPGSKGRIALLLRMQHHLDGYDRDQGFTVLNPLVAQPIVEFCLGIPTWEMCAGGRNRAIVRDAFVRDLPPMITDRRGKAGPDSFIVKLLESKLDPIRDRLLDGSLASRKLLDRIALEAALRPDRQCRPAEYLRIMALADCEAWIRYWQG